MKNTPLLDMLLNRASELKKADCPMIACALLSAFLEFACDAAENSFPNLEEASTLTQKVHALFPDSEKARAAISRLLHEASVDFGDKLHWMQILHEAENDAVKNGDPEITSLTLLKCLQKNPGKLLAPVMQSSAILEETGKSEMNLPRMGKQLKPEKEAETENIPKPEKKQEPETNPETDAETNGDSNNAVAELTASVKKLQEALLQNVFGQDKAVSTFTSGYFFAELSRLTDKSRTKPRGTFLFAGPPGVGKTFLAEKAASLLNLPFRRFDMSEYSDYDAKQRFSGADALYNRSSPGTVTGFVAENPRCVLLFDEIEKAHLQVIHLFLQILDAGHIHDSHKNTEVSFTDAIMIFTTNAGRSIYEEDETGNYSELPRKVILKAIGQDRNPTTGEPFFPAAICSRFASGNVVMFNHISAHQLLRVAKNEIQKNIRNTQGTTGLSIDIEESVYSAILFAEGGNADARTIRSRAESFVTSELYELFRLISPDKTNATIEDIRKIHIGIDLPNSNEKIRSLFEIADKPQILVFGSQSVTKFCEQHLPDLPVFAAHSREEACALFAEHNISLVLCDIFYGVDQANTPYLNLEDVLSDGRDFLKYLLMHRPNTPIYLLISEENKLNGEEKVSYYQQGVRGILSLSDTLNDQINELCTILHQQQSIRILARSSKIVSFETAQSISENGTEAAIRLYDFRLIHAVEAGDGDNMVDDISRPNVAFEDIIGADSAVEELKFFADQLKNPQKNAASGLRMPRGILLYGPPGTGKTMLAKALAHASDVPFIQTEGNRFLKKYVGEGPEAVHRLFQTARKYAPAIIFIDEIDAIAKERTGGEFERTADILTALLTEMDGFSKDPSKPIFVLAATNYDVTPGTPKSLDSALMRRFDRRIYVDLPSKEDRLRYLNKKAAGNALLALSSDKLENIAGRSVGMSLAGLESVLDLAARMAFRSGKTVVTDELFDEALEEFNSGERRAIEESSLLQTARHEAGHTILCWLSGQIPNYLTIVARGNHGGYMQREASDTKAYYTKNELLNNIRISLGGRAAEIVCYGTEAGITTGASGDIRQATSIARNIVCSFGMDDSFGLAAISEEELVNGTLALEVRQAVNRILAQEMRETIRIIEEHRDKLDALAEELLRKNNLNEKQIRAILEP